MALVLKLIFPTEAWSIMVIGIGQPSNPALKGVLKGKMMSCFAAEAWSRIVALQMSLLPAVVLAKLGKTGFG